MAGAIAIFLLLLYFLVKMFLPKESMYYKGPAPSIAEQKENLKFIAAYIAKYPGSGLAKAYPQLLNSVLAGLRYDLIERLRAEGRMTEDEYQKELEKILPLVDIKEDIQPLLHK